MKEKKKEEKQEKQNEVSPERRRAIGKRIKRLRMECKDFEVHKQICQACGGCDYQRCTTCNDKETISKTIAGNAGSNIKAEAILKVIFYKSRNTLTRMEKGTASFDNNYRATYEALFGEEYVREYVDGINSSFKKDTSVRLHNFLCREKELKELEKLVKKNKITIVCADGGVGKTTLVDEYIRRYGLGDYNYYQTIVFSDAEQFEMDHFLNKIELSAKGEAELEEFEKTEDSKDKEKLKKQFIRKKLENLYVPALFVLDDFTSVGQELKCLAEDFPEFRFLITTRSNADIGKSVPEARVMELNCFTPEQALTVFNEQRAVWKVLPLNEEDFQPIYDYCEGNAEALYFIACMLRYKSVESFNVYLKEQTFIAYDKTERKQRSGKMPERLSKLFKFSKLFPDGISTVESKDKKIRALAVLSLTKMEKIPQKSLVQFLTGDEEEELDAENALEDLTKYGFIKSDSESVWMHPLIANALSLNEIEKYYNIDILFFSFLSTKNASIKEKYKLFEQREVNIPKGIFDIEVKFRSFLNLELVNFSHTVTKIGNYAFANALDFDDEAKFVFYANDIEEEVAKLSSVSQRPMVEINMGENIKEIGEGAFLNNTVKELILSESLRKIGESAFSECCNLEIIKIPDSVIDIGKYAFYKCYSLKNVFLPKNSLQQVNGMTFGCCSSLQKISIPDSVKEICSGAFYHCENLKEVSIGSNTRIIGAGAFYECVSLKNIDLSSIEKLESSAFCYCRELEKVKLGNNTQFIGDGCFRGCVSLKDIYIPASVKEIEADVFSGCVSLQSIIVDKNNAFYKVVDGELCSLENGNVLFSIKENNKKKDEDRWFLEEDLLEVILDENNRDTLTLKNKKGELDHFEQIAVTDINKKVYLILETREDTILRDRGIYRLEKIGKELYIVREWDFNLSRKIFECYYMYIRKYEYVKTQNIKPFIQLK